MIYKKLLEFQKLGISIKKDKRNPHFKNDYASLNEVLDKVKTDLNKLGVVIIQEPTAFNNVGQNFQGLRTRLYDTEDETSIECYTPFINPTDMQKLGGAITYARRYALVSMLALEDDDDDGNTASNAQKSVTPTRTWTLAEALHHVAQSTTETELNTLYKELSATLQKDNEVIAKCKEIKKTLTS